MAILFCGAKLFLQFAILHFEELFCVTILNLSQWLTRYRLKMFIFLALVVILFDGAELGVQNVVEGIMGNTQVNLFKIWTSGSRGDAV